MPVEITQEEMNILNLNGISAEDVRANVEFSRASGLDDFAIRQQFTNTLNELKPITKTSANDIEKINEWQNKGEMKPFELANRSSMFFNGTYDNIDNSANLTAVGKSLKNSSKNQLVEDRIENQRKEKEARDERVNNGSASFFDRVGSALDRWGKNVYNAQLESAELNKNRQGVDESDSTKRYEVVGIDRAGQPIYNEIDLLHKIGFREGMADTLPKGIAIGAIAEAFDTKKEREIKDKILKGEAIRQDELDFINRKMDFEQEKKVRGYSIGGQIGSTVGYGLGFSADLLTGSALFKALGAGAIGTTLTTNISNVAKGNQALQTAGKAIGWGTNRLAETALTTIVNSPSRLFQGYQERMLNNEMKLTDNGNAVFSISQEKPATALFKSLQSIFVEYFTEIAGGEILRYAAKPIAKAGGKVAQAVENSLIKNLFAKYPKVETLIKNSADVFSKKFEEFNNLKVVGQSKEWIKNQVHFDGFLEEMGEEALADVLNLTLGTNNEERSFENYAKAIFKTPEEWAVLAGAIAIQGAGLSMVGASVANNMAKNGASPEEIQTVIENLTENQLRDLQAEQIADGAINIDETEEQHFEKTVNTVADSLIESGQFKDREKADKAVRLGATMLESISKKTGKSLDDLMAEDMAEINETEDYGVIDENGVLQGNVEHREVLTVENRINALLDEIELFNDETNPEDIDRVVSEISLLENLNSGDVSIEDIELANDMIAAYEAEGNTEFANLLRTALDDASAGNSAAYFQRIDESNIENEFGETVEDLTNIISEDVKNILADNFVEEDEFKFEDIRLYGSYTKGRNKETSDLDVLVQYSGTMREDGAFNMFADAGLSITDKNGRTVKIDINPINIADSGTIDEHIDRMEKLEQADKNVYYQAAYHGTPHRFEEFSTEHIGSGEGAQAHGWGLYFAGEKEVSENYRAKLINRNGNSEYEFSVNGEKISEKAHNYLVHNLNGHLLYTSANSDNLEDLKADIAWHTQYLKRGNKFTLNLINLLQEQIDKIESNPKLSITKFLEEVPSDDKYRFQCLAAAAKRAAKDENRKANIQDVLKWIKEQQKPFKDEREKDLEIVKELEQIDLENIKLTKEMGQLFEVDIPENEVLLDEEKKLSEQTDFVKEKIYEVIESLSDEETMRFTSQLFDSDYTLTGYYLPVKMKDNPNECRKYLREEFYNDFRLYTGKELYHYLEFALGHAKWVSLKLNEHGIKGITYDGRRDGRCYVIFDDKAVDVVQTYYQSANKTLLDGFRELLKNIINNNQEKEIFTVSELLPHIPAFSRIRNFFNGIEDVKIELVSDTKNELKNGYYRASDDTVRINKDALYVSEMPIAAIETLLHELQHAHQKRNYDKYKNILSKNLNLSDATKQRLQNYIDNYEDMKEATKVYREFREKNKKQLAELDAMKKQLGKAKMLEEFKKRENAKLAILYKQNKDLYNNYKNSSGEMEARIISRELINQMGYGEIYDNQRRSFLSSFGNSGQLNGSRLYGSRSSGRIGRIGYNNRGRSETNRLYQSIGEDSEGTENISGRSLGYSEQQRIFIDNQQAEVLRDRYQKVKGSFIPAENIITLFKDADESTIVHEFAHWWLDKLVKYAEENEEIAEDLKEIRKFVRNNGGAFTTEEHERFARGFEAYIRTGSAKTNRLKRLFEDFKNALLSLYDSIKNLGFSEEEMPQINNLFERLLTTENQRIQAAVFDRCDKIQEQIQEIRDNQEKELADIDEIYQNNIERNLKDNKKKQQVNEYIRLAQKSASRIPKAVREYQDRYKQATLEILEVATGYKRQFIANPRNWETIEQKIADLSDEITSGDGMRDNWREFYFDTGVSYDNDEIDGDYKLAEQAFKVLTSGDYSQAKDDRMDDEEIGKFFGMFDYLKGKVLSLRGENKDAAYEALTSIFNNMPSMPNEAVQELVDELQKVGEQFIDQKAMESPNKFSIPNVSAAVQFRAYVISKLHNMKVYDPESKRVIRLSSVNKLYNILKYANSVLDTKEIIRKINAHAILQLENRQKHILDREIQKQVRINSKLVKVGALKKGKFDWKTNTIFSELVQMNRLNIEDARKEYNKLTQADKIEIGEERESWDENPTESLAAPTDFQAALKIKFLEYKSNKTNDRNLLATRSLLEDIIELKFEGRRAKNEEELKKNLSRYDYETNLVQILNRHRYNGKAKFLAKWVTGETPLTSEGTLANWESILTTVFNRETAAKYSLLKDESDAEVFAFKKCAEFYDKAAEIYHFEKPKNIAEKAWKTLVDFNNVQPLANLFREYENEMTTVIQVTYNKDTNKLVETNVEISRAEIITLYAWSLNKELKERLKTQYGEEQLEEMFSKLSDEDKQFAWLMVDICDSMYNESNEVFIRTTGLSLPRLENYVPSKTERVGSDIDMLHEHIVRSTNPSFIKSRKNCKRIKMDPQTPFAIILPHINKTARYIVLSEKVNFYNRIFASNDIQATLIDIYGKKTGKKIHQVLLNQLGTSTYANYAKSVTVGKSLLDQVASNYITSRIGGNMKVMLSQLTGLMNYAENMPAGEWAKRFAKVILKPKATVKYMFENCDYLKARIAGNSINEVLSTVTNEVDRFRTFRNFCISNTKFGDVLTLCLGGKPYVDYLMEQGLSKEEAFKKYVEDTLRAQQSGHNSATSAWQKKQAETPINRMIFAFNNTNLQFERKFVEALSNYSKKDITGKEFAKAFVIYKVLNPVVFSSFLTNLSLISLFRAIVDGDDEEGRAVGIDILEALALANLKAYGLLGIVADCLCRFAFSKIKKERYFETQLPLISDIEEQLSKMVGKDDLTLGDYVTALCAATDYTTGIAATRIKNSVGGFGDIAEGEYGTGLLRLLGYGKYRATVAATGEEPKRKKK
ncbi:MAG: hypothetical protein J6V44_08985 [Methanobrevibacter sp.]|nr:hypothetical protein [Methanobrevibacter sp.]